MEEFLMAPIIVFMVIVAPIWIVMPGCLWFRLKDQKRNDEQNSLDELAEIANTMEERISTLESILDAETPDWRSKYE